MTPDQRRAVVLEVMLDDLRASSSGRIAAREFKRVLTSEEYGEYRTALASNREQRDDESLPSLSGDAQSYWDRFRDVYMRSTRLMSPQQRRQLLDEAAELYDDFAKLSGADQNEFHKADGSVRTWGDALTRLEYDLPIRKTAVDHRPWLTNVESYTQERFLETLIDRLRSSTQSASLEVRKLGASDRLRGLLKRLRR